MTTDQGQGAAALMGCHSGTCTYRAGLAWRLREVAWCCAVPSVITNQELTQLNSASSTTNNQSEKHLTKHQASSYCSSVIVYCTYPLFLASSQPLVALSFLSAVARAAPLPTSLLSRLLLLGSQLIFTISIYYLLYLLYSLSAPQLPL